jgi:hypothetical protein
MSTVCRYRFVIGLTLTVLAATGCDRSSRPGEERDTGASANRSEPRAAPDSAPVRELPPATGCGQGDLNELEYEKVSRFLRKRYRPDSTLAPEDKRSLGVRYIAERACFKVVPLPTLYKAMPATRLYVTELDSNYAEFPRVKAVLTLTDLDGLYEVVEAFSVPFEEPQPYFVTKFLSAVYPPQDRERAASEIASVFGVLTPDGQVKNARFTDADYRAELWSGAKHATDLFIDFTENGRMREVTLTEAKSTKIVVSVAQN